MGGSFRFRYLQVDSPAFGEAYPAWYKPSSCHIPNPVWNSFTWVADPTGFIVTRVLRNLRVDRDAG